MLNLKKIKKIKIKVRTLPSSKQHSINKINVHVNENIENINFHSEITNEIDTLFVNKNLKSSKKIVESRKKLEKKPVFPKNFPKQEYGNNFLKQEIYQTNPSPAIYYNIKKNKEKNVDSNKNPPVKGIPHVRINREKNEIELDNKDFIEIKKKKNGLSKKEDLTDRREEELKKEMERIKLEKEQIKKQEKELLKLEKEKKKLKIVEKKKLLKEKKEAEQQLRFEEKKRLKKQFIKELELKKQAKKEETKKLAKEREKQKQELIKKLELEQKAKKEEKKKLAEEREKQKQELIKKLELEQKAKKEETKKLAEEREKAVEEKIKEEVLQRQKSELVKDHVEKDKPVEKDTSSETENDFDSLIQAKGKVGSKDSFFDEDVKKLIPVIDSLLEKLPADVIDDFANSDDFVLYEKVVKKYKK